MTPKRKAHERGFTLIELLVSLVGGLIVALAVVGVSKEATNTFYEESRTSQAEMSLRGAVERLRNDIQRAGFMSTGNIVQDPFVPLDPTSQTRVSAAAPLGLRNLQGIRVILDGSAANTPLSAIAGNGYSPDAIELAGNMTSLDAYPIVAAAPGGAGCGGQMLTLQTQSPAVRRVRTSSHPLAVLQQIFQPVAGEQFLLRVSDDLGRSEFVPGCKAQTVSGDDGTQIYYVEVDPVYTLALDRYGFIEGRLSVNPVQIVRWELNSGSAASATYAPIDDTSGVAKYDLLRYFVDATGTRVGEPEVVAEYAVDLKFALTTDEGDYTARPPAASYQSYDFGAALVGTRTSQVFGAAAATVMPQRSRSVRMRLSTRSQLPDRTQALTLPNNTYNMRYCTVLAGCTVDHREWARVRTVTTETSVPNLSKGFY